MDVASPAWLDAVRSALELYDEPLLRQIATRLCRPRSHWPVEDLIERSLAALQNPAALDRRLKDVSASSRRLLSLLRHCDKATWTVGSLCELGAMLDPEFSHEQVIGLIEAGLIFPHVATSAGPRGKLKSLSHWLAEGSALQKIPMVVVPPLVAQRLESEALELSDLPPATSAAGIVEADGLEWLLRLSVVHQIVHGGPLRRTQGGDFFKRDSDRLSGDSLLGAPPGDALAEVPDVGLVTVELGLASGVLVEQEGEIRASALALPLGSSLPLALARLWECLLSIETWHPSKGWRADVRYPAASAWLMALVCLGQYPADAWVTPDAIDDWVGRRHPFWKAEKPVDTGIASFLLGIAQPLRLAQAAKRTGGGWAVRLSPLARHILHFGGEPINVSAFPQTLLVQPNLEILAYRQGLTPDLIPRLGAFAVWKTLGAACTLQFEPKSVYHALESGETLETIVQMLDRHGMKPTPVPVLDALRTWANKRDRISVYPAAALFEFATAADLNEALARGVPAIRVTDRLAIVSRESDIDYKHFRLTGTRDYCLPPERCVEVEPDGVTLVVDLAKSDLLLDTEVMRFAEPSTRTPAPGRKIYQVTPATLAQARQQAMSWANLESWFQDRAGLPGPPAVRLLHGAADAGPVEVKRQVVLHVPSADTADGLMQWPTTRRMIASRLGPTTLAVLEQDVEGLTAILRSLDMTLRYEDA